ncbi:MAG: hypothetical protein VXZ39_08440 [Planctomycetota bacterium]|nr:hypothetical protein [Planctomycetota bacterium]MEC8510816.1 hypothetical protein [Planctomycetota bacterium]
MSTPPDDRAKDRERRSSHASFDSNVVFPSRCTDPPRGVVTDEVSARDAPSPGPIAARAELVSLSPTAAAMDLRRDGPRSLRC